MRYFRKMIGKRIFLSPINPDDVEIYTQWANELETAMPLGQAARINSLMAQKDALEKQSKLDHNFAIIRYDKDREQLIGNCDLYDVNLIDRKASLGIFIGDHGSRGKGYGAEAIMLLLEYGFGLLNLENIMLTVSGYNHRGIKCYEKCGFKLIGRRRNANFVSGKTYDVIYMDILRSEFNGDIRDRMPMYF